MSETTMQLSKNAGIALKCMGNPSTLVNCAKIAEKAGFDSIWLVEVSDADVLALASAICELTQDIKIATGVVNSCLRLPTFLAMGAATLSELSKGRFILGVGAGHPPMSYSVEIPKDKPITRLRETLEIVRLCLTGESVEYRGQLFKVHGFKLDLKVQYHVPIFGAAMGLNMVKTVAKVADGVLLMMPTTEYMKKIKQTIDSSDRSRKEQLSVACHFVTVVSESRAEAEEIAKQMIVNYLGIQAYRNSFVRMGFSEEVQDLESALNDGELKDTVWEKVPRNMVEKTIIYGTPEECIEKINTFVSLGVTHPVIYPCMTRSGFPNNINEAIRLLGPFLQSHDSSAIMS